MCGHSEKTAVNHVAGSNQTPNLPTPWSQDFPTSTAVRNKCLLFKPPSVWYFCYSSLNRQGRLLNKWMNSDNTPNPCFFYWARAPIVSLLILVFCLFTSPHIFPPTKASPLSSLFTGHFPSLIQTWQRKEKKARLSYVQGVSQTQPISLQAGGRETMLLMVVDRQGRHGVVQCTGSLGGSEFSILLCCQLLTSSPHPIWPWADVQKWWGKREVFKHQLKWIWNYLSGEKVLGDRINIIIRQMNFSL